MGALVRLLGIVLLGSAVVGGVLAAPYFSAIDPQFLSSQAGMVVSLGTFVAAYVIAFIVGSFCKLDDARPASTVSLVAFCLFYGVTLRLIHSVSDGRLDGHPVAASILAVVLGLLEILWISRFVAGLFESASRA